MVEVSHGRRGEEGEVVRAHGPCSEARGMVVIVMLGCRGIGGGGTSGGGGSDVFYLWRVVMLLLMVMLIMMVVVM